MAACSLTVPRMGSQLCARDGAGLPQSGTGKADGRAPHVVTLWGTGPLGTAGQARELLLLAVPGGQSPHMGRDPGGNHRVNTSGCRGWGQEARRTSSSGGFNLETLSHGRGPGLAAGLGLGTFTVPPALGLAPRGGPGLTVWGLGGPVHSPCLALASICSFLMPAAGLPQGWLGSTASPQGGWGSALCWEVGAIIY